MPGHRGVTLALLVAAFFAGCVDPNESVVEDPLFGPDIMPVEIRIKNTGDAQVRVQMFGVDQTEGVIRINETRSILPGTEDIRRVGAERNHTLEFRVLHLAEDAGGVNYLIPPNGCPEGRFVWRIVADGPGVDLVGNDAECVPEGGI